MPYERVASGLAYVPQGRMVFPTLTVEENLETGLPPGERRIPEELYRFFPVLLEMKKAPRGQFVGRAATTAGDCKSAGEPAPRPSFGRADRGDSAFDYQGPRACS